MMNYQPTAEFNRSMAQVELPEKILTQLIASGVLHGNECKCLNNIAKNVLWKALLSCSIKVEC